MKKYLSMAALALVGAMMTGCSNEDDGVSNPQQPENQSKSVTLTATIGLDGGITRALTATGVKTFADGETMAIIYKNNSGNTVKAVSNPLNGSGDIADGGKNAKFTFTLDNPDRTQDVTYIYPAAMAGETDVDYTKLNSQSGGTLADLGSKYDLCTKSGAWNGGNLPTLTLENQLAILAVTLKNSTGSSEITSGITSMTISDGTNNYTVTRSAAAGPIYVAIRPTISATINITATDGTTYYTKSLTGKTYEANNGYNVSWKMEASELARPLTFEAKTAGAKVTLKKNGSAPNISMKYSTDGTNWTTYTVGNAITLASVGDKVMFRGTNNNTLATRANRYHYFFLSGDCYAYGNVMSLLSANGFAFATSLSSILSFYSLFTDCSTLYSHPEKALVLPATTLAANCYQYMFLDCTNLTTAPALPAETLQSNCYYGMFNGCTSLTTAPALPAETLAVSCYSGMFYGCTSLATAPALPAETLADYCYYQMFCNCTSLNSVTCLATNISASNCTTNWLMNVASGGTFTKAASMTGWTTGVSGIPSGWTVESK